MFQWCCYYYCYSYWYWDYEDDEDYEEEGYGDGDDDDDDHDDDDDDEIFPLKNVISCVFKKKVVSKSLVGNWPRKVNNLWWHTPT